MNTKSVIFVVILIEFALKCFVEGLQCYICENCSEHEDFTELHICGEIPVKSTGKPITLPGILENNKTSAIPTLMPENAEDYQDIENSNGDVSAQASSQENTTKPSNIQDKTTFTQISFSTMTNKLTTPTLIERESTIATTTANKTTSFTTTTAAVITTKTKPTVQPDYDDYLEYEDPVMDKRSVKINEPICYMIKYQVNNTNVINRGCTSFINSNKNLTCHSLYNGTLMESCRICSTNGCNKFISDDNDNDDHGFSISAAGDLKQFGILLLICLLIVM